MVPFNLIIGAALLLFGRRLFWLFVAGVGFVVGARLTTEFFVGQSQAGVLAIAIVLGIVGALASIFLQRLVVGIAGFLAGGYLLSTLAVQLGSESWVWIAFLVGGIVGAILIAALFDWALILLSSLMGAAVISQSVPLDPSASQILFVVLAVVGVVVQARQLSPSPPPPRPQES